MPEELAAPSASLDEASPPWNRRSRALPRRHRSVPYWQADVNRYTGRSEDFLRRQLALTEAIQEARAKAYPDGIPEGSWDHYAAQSDADEVSEIKAALPPALGRSPE